MKVHPVSAFIRQEWLLGVSLVTCLVFHLVFKDVMSNVARWEDGAVKGEVHV